MSEANVSAEEITLPIKRTEGETLEDRLTANAYHNILPARYLRKDADGNLVETQEELFARIAKNIALAEAVFEARKAGIELSVTPAQLKPGHPRRDQLASEVFGEGTTAEDDTSTVLTPENVNKFAYETVVPELPSQIRGHVETTAAAFQDFMEDLSFTPNSPTIMNAGDELQQLSACFVMSPDDDLTDIHETAKNAAEVFQCLTKDTRVHTASNGLTSIKDVEPGDNIRQGQTGLYRNRRVVETHAYDDAPIYRIKTAPGITIRGTPTHRLRVEGEWRCIEDIEPGDTISIELGWIPEGTDPVELDQVPAGARWHDQRIVENEDIITLHAEGMSDYAIAEQLDCSSSMVQQRRANELGLPTNGRGGRPAGRSFDEDRFVELYEAGQTDSQMAEQLGVSTSAVRSYRAANQCEPNGEAVKSVCQPASLTTNLAELVGLWIGDGSKHADGIRFHLENDELVERVDRLSRQLFDTGADWTWAKGCYEVTISSHEVKRFWLKNFGEGKVESALATVPAPIRAGDQGIIAAFLRGLFSADGSLNKSLYPTLYSASEQLITDVQQLLIGLGIPATKWEWDNDERDYYTVRVTDDVGILNFAKQVGFVDDRTDAMRERIEEVDFRGTTCGNVNGWSWDVDVASVERDGFETVYDVTVEGDPQYVANSIVSHNSGGGCGYAFWQLRPYGDAVGSTGGIASGPITFMRTYDQLCETIAQGGTRRGAQMGVMRVSHPDVIEFIHAKNKDVSLAHCLRLNDPDDYTYTSFNEALEEARGLIDDEGRVPKHLRNAVEGHLSNFNISVGVTDDFMDALANDESFTFTNPRTEQPHIATEETKEMWGRYDLGEYVEVGEELAVPATVIWERIVDGAYENGEPGVIYLERVNKEHSFDIEEHPDHRILATNPCLTGDMRVQLADGSTQEIRELAERDERVDVRTLSDGNLSTRSARAFKTKTDADIIRVTTLSGISIRVTPDHKIRSAEGDWVEAGSLSQGDEILGLSTLLATAHGPIQETTAETVARVVADGTEDVYDLSVTETHNFFASGSGGESINVHNCGEQPLEEYEACNLGHINLSTLAAHDAPDWRVWYDRHGDEYDSFETAIGAFLDEAIDWEEFDRRIELGTRFLENVVTMSDFPVEKITETVRQMRKIGLGIMGLAQLYIQLGIRYGSEPGNEVARQLMTHINHHAKWTSHELAEERGVFGEWERSKYADPVKYREWFEHQTGLDADKWPEGFSIRNHNVTTIAPTGCVDEDTLVTTDEGLRPIRDLDNTTAAFEQWGEIDVEVATDGGVKTATAVYDNGFSDVKSIATEEGFSVSATPNHRFRTIDQNGEYVWREARDFDPGDAIVLQRGATSTGMDVDLNTIEREQFHHNTSETLTLPDALTPELAEFLGYYMGDGYLHENVGVKLVVESSATDLERHLRALGKEVFGVEPTVEDRETRRILSFGGRHLPRFFEDNGWAKEPGNTGEGAASSFVPTQVLCAGPESGKAFLRGLFEADECASRKVELSTVSETLATQVQQLLLNLGHIFVRHSLDAEDLGRDHFDDRTRHTLRGANKYEDKRFLEEIGFITKSATIELTNQSYGNDTYPPAIVERLREADGYDEVSNQIKKCVNQSPINGAVSRKLVCDIERETGETITIEGRRLTDFFVATVAEVGDDVAYTKDISVPSNNTYVANGFVTHNTTSMVGNTTGGCEPIYNVAYYKNVSDDVQGDEMLVEFDDYFLRVLEANDIDVESVKREAQEQMANNEFDGVEGLSTVPDAIGELFVITADLTGKEHAAVQCSCQEGVDSAISKTCNFPHDAAKEDMDDVFRYIYENGGKGVTVYRDGTRSKQVLTTRADNAEFADEDEAAEALINQIEEVFGSIESFNEHKEVRARMEGEVASLAAAIIDDETGYAQVRSRPDVLNGVTQRIDTGYGKLYVNINEDEHGRPFELFATIGNSGGFTNSFTEALAKTISTALRAGVDPREIATELTGIRSPKVAWDKGVQINSVPDAIGTALLRYLDGDVDLAYPQQKHLTDIEEETQAELVDADDTVRETDGGAAAMSPNDDATQALLDAGESPECPECGSLTLHFVEGCKTCGSCGWSEC